MMFALSTSWQAFIKLIVWVPPILLCVFALELVAERGPNPNADR